MCVCVCDLNLARMTSKRCRVSYKMKFEMSKRSTAAKYYLYARHWGKSGCMLRAEVLIAKVGWSVRGRSVEWGKNLRLSRLSEHFLCYVANIVGYACLVSD